MQKHARVIYTGLNQFFIYPTSYNSSSIGDILTQHNFLQILADKRRGRHVGTSSHFDIASVSSKHQAPSRILSLHT